MQEPVHGNENLNFINSKHAANSHIHFKNCDPSDSFQAEQPLAKCQISFLPSKKRQKNGGFPLEN
jgi:hypothetical protein